MDGKPLPDEVTIGNVDWDDDALMTMLEIGLDRSVKGADFRGTDYDAPSGLLAKILRHQGPLPTRPGGVPKWQH